MGQFDFQFQNVGGGSGATQAANSATNIQNQAADRITKSFEQLGELGSAKAEREEEAFNTLAEKNLQTELNLIKQLDSVDDVEDYQLDEDVLREKYGNAFGGESFEQGIGALNAAVDSELTNELGKEQSMATRQIRLDGITQDNLLQEYLDSTKGQTIDQQRKGYQEWLIGKGEEVPAGTFQKGVAEIMAQDDALNSKTNLMKRKDAQGDNARKADIKAQSDSLTRLTTAYETQGGADVHTELKGPAIENYVSEKLIEKDLPIDSIFRDQTGAVDKGSLVKHTIMGADAITQLFAEEGANMQRDVLAQMDTQLAAIPDKTSDAYKKLVIERAKVEANTKPLVVTKPMIDHILTLRRLDTAGKTAFSKIGGPAFGGGLGGGELNTAYLYQTLKDEYQTAGSNFRDVIIKGYTNQADSRKLKSDIDVKTKDLSDAEVNQLRLAPTL